MALYPSGMNRLDEGIRRGSTSTLPVNFTAPIYGGTRLGPENSFQMFSGTNATTTAQGASILGTANARAINAPMPNMPASGDFAYAFFIRTAASSFGGNARNETLMGVAGQTSSGGTGGALQFTSPTVQATVAGGSTLDATNSGKVSARRQHSTGWQWWPQTTLGAVMPGVTIAPDTEYLVVAGTVTISGSSYGVVKFVNLADGTIQTATSPNAHGAQARPSAPLFNLVGALGATSGDRAGFAGDLGEIVAMHGAVPSDAQCQAVATGTSLTQLAANAGATLVWRNLLDHAAQSGGTLASATGSAATLLSGAIGLSPARGFKTSGVRLDRLGNYWVFPLAPAATSGVVWFEGVASPGATVACFLRYTDGATSAQVRATADGSGRFVATIVSPWKKPFYRSGGNVADATDCHHEMDVMDIGYVIPTIGESEVVYLFAAGWASSSDLTPGASNDTGLSATAGPEGASTGRWGAVVDLAQRNTNGHLPRRSLGPKARPDRMLGKGVWADGAHELAARIIADTGCSVMLVNVARGGHTIDQFAFDRVPFSQALTLSGSGAGPYTATIQLADATVQAKFGPAGLGKLSSGDAAALVVSNNFAHQVRPGTFSLDLGGGVVITDTKVSNASGTLSGPGGMTGTITYVAGTGTGKASISLTFPSTPAGTAGTLSFQIKSETADASNSNKTANLDGYGVIELLDEVAGRGLRYGWSLGMIWWSTANISDANGGAAMRGSVLAKYELMRALLKSYVRSGVDTALADAPVMVAQKGRDTGNAGADDNARQLAFDLWAGGRSWVRRGGAYYDNALDTAVSPHETYTQDSGPRIGRRLGAYLAMHLLGSFVEAPVFRAGAADRTSSTVLTVPLASIGAGLSLVTGSGGNANALDQWYVGGTLVANDATTIARIRADGQAVELVKLSGTWATGAESNVLYVSQGPGSGASPPASLLYDNRGGFSNEPGLLAMVKLG